MSSCQCIGIGIGLCVTEGVASGSIIMRIGGPVIIGSGWCSHVLKVLALYRSNRYFSNLSRLSAVGGYGNELGLGGGLDLFGHWQLWLFSGGNGSLLASRVSPTVGKFEEMRPKATQACFDRNMRLVEGVKYTI